MATAWMIFGNDGEYITSPNMPPTFRSALQNYVQTDSWVVDNVFFAPDTNGYLVLGPNLTFGAGYPQDLFDAAWQLFQAGYPPAYSAWYSPGCWAVFSSNGAYYLGPNVPAEVSQTIQLMMQPDDGGRSEYFPTNLVFSPSGDWLLMGYDPRDEGGGTYNYSAGFPADALAVINALPVHVAAATINFDPDGGWWMIDTTGQSYWSMSTPADVQAAAQQFVQSGNAVTAVQFATIGAYTMPIQLSASLTGPISIETWSNQSVNLSLSYQGGEVQEIPPQSATFGISTTTLGVSAAGQATLTVAAATGLSAGQVISINPSGATFETATILSVLQGAPSGNPPTTLKLAANLQFPHATGEAVSASTPLFGDAQWPSTFQIAIPASNVVVPCTFEFTVQSAEEDPGYTGGNHAHFGVQFQQVLLDPSGNLVPGPDGTFPYWQDIPGAGAEVDLWGPNSSNGVGGPAPGSLIAGIGQTVQQTVMVPIDFSTVQTALRLQFRCWLGDTNDNGPNQWDPGPMQSIAVLGERGSVFAQIPQNAAGGVYETIGQYAVMVIPSDLIQMKILPVGLVYDPPGSASFANFSYGTTTALSWGFSDLLGNSYSAANSQTFTLQNADKGGFTLGYSSSMYNISLGVSQSSQTTQSWDSSTSSGTTSLVQNNYSLTISDISKFSVSTSLSSAAPGDAAPPAEQPFQADQFVLLVRPQLAVWAYPGLNCVQMLGSWPGLWTVSVEQLADAMIGTQGYVIASPEGTGAGCTLNAQDCANLLSLDPFYTARWQGAALSGARWQYLAACAFGDNVPVPAQGPPTHKTMNLTQIVESETATKQSLSYTFATASETKYTYSSTSGSAISFSDSGSVYGIGEGMSGTDSSSATSGWSQSASQSVKVGYQVSSGADFTTATSYSGTLNDNGPSTVVGSPPSQALSPVLFVQSTDGFSVNDVIVINSGYDTEEAVTIQSVQVGVAFNLATPLVYAHGFGESVRATWNQLLVYAYRDVLLGGIAFQDQNAPTPIQPALILRRPRILAIA